MSPIFQSVDLSNQLYDAEQDHLHDDLAPLATAEDRAQRTHDLLMQCVDASDDERERLHEEIVIINVEVAESIVMRYRNRGVPVDDLVQVACLGLVKAARGFDPTKSDNFLGYAVPTILGELKRFFRDNAWAVRPPRRIQELQAEIAAASAQLMQDTGRVPTPADVAEVLEIDVKEVVEALSADGCFAPTSLDRPRCGISTARSPAASARIGATTEAIPEPMLRISPKAAKAATNKVRMTIVPTLWIAPRTAPSASRLAASAPAVFSATTPSAAASALSMKASAFSL